ncbi:MAG: hypothetical protein JWR80_7893 [Bradyrhizobium sp.]|nr:hypothetical protein [Bradyrhizobium sp.]
MARKAARAGKISTFFSYKGGVGRTMAVANVGFIAAMAGKRVLLMDWDLEAPGLAVYFRGITDHEAASDIRRARGVLDFFTEWRDGLLHANGPQQVSAIFKRFAAGEPFAACACPLLPKAHLPKGAKLDIIGAGAAIVGGEHPVPYAEALSRFHWSSFFDEFAGGGMLEALRSWCKRNYDFILVDSRTGLADVAGICTMQLPDEVVLCFVLNRQNTEGVADIAASIRAARGDDVAIRLSPMRVSKDRPTEEADARARAQREMRNAGLLPQRIEEDMAKLAIGAAANIPFYETLAPFAATSATADPLTFEYLRMAQELTGKVFEAPRVDAAWFETVRRRLQPRMTTVEYLASLESADPDRAFEELDRFLDGALDADPTRELDADYVGALVDAAMESSDWLWDGEDGPPVRALADKAILLLRQLHSIGGGDWRLPLVEALDEYDVRWGRGDAERRVSALATRDEILADGPPLPEITVRRVQLRLGQVRMVLRRDPARAATLLDEAGALLAGVGGPLTPDHRETITVSHAELAAMRAELHDVAGDIERARAGWREVIDLLSTVEHSYARSLKAEAQLNLALMLDVRDPSAVTYVFNAARLWRAALTRDVPRCARALDIVLASKEPAANSATFAIAVFGRNVSRRVPFGTVADMPEQATQLALLLDRLTQALPESGRRRLEALQAITQVAEQQFHRLWRLHAVKKRGELKKVILAYAGLCDTLATAGVSEESLESLTQRLDELRSVSRPTK